MSLFPVKVPLFEKNFVYIYIVTAFGGAREAQEWTNLGIHCPFTLQDHHIIILPLYIVLGCEAHRDCAV